MYHMTHGRQWPTPWQRMQSLLGCLEHLQSQFKNAIASLVGGSVAKAVRDFVRFLLGNGPDIARREDDGLHGEDGWQREGEGREQESLWDERPEYQQQDESEEQGWLSSLVALVLSCIAPITAWAGSLLA
jgi:hypothetical protein